VEVLKTPKWFKDEMKAQEEAEKQAGWLRSFDRFQAHASDPNTEKRIRQEIEGKLEETEKREDAPEGVVALAKKLMRIVRRKKDPARSHIPYYALAALLYFIVPMDAVPDFIPGGGLVDDAFILKYAWDQVSEFLKRH
jgi:uncharacterized membrane protein YkvA (DUF1232 family)